MDHSRTRTRKGGFATRSARNGTPFSRIVFYLELFWTILSSNPRVICPDRVFRIGKSSTFVRDELAWSLGKFLLRLSPHAVVGRLVLSSRKTRLIPGKALPRRGMAIAYIFHFPIVRVDSGLVLGDVRDSGLGISLFRFMQVPSKVPSGLMQVDAVVCFRDWGLFWAS